MSPFCCFVLYVMKNILFYSLSLSFSLRVKEMNNLFPGNVDSYKVWWLQAFVGFVIVGIILYGKRKEMT